MHELYELYELKQKQQRFFKISMTGRSLRASPEGIRKLRQAIKHNGWTQGELKDELGLKGRSSIGNVLKGRGIERSTFEDLCHLLDLAVEEIAAPVSDSTDLEVDITVLVQQIRQQTEPLIRERCGSMRVLDMTQPIELEGEQGIYTNVNILEKVIGRRWLDITELLQNSDLEEFDRFGLNRITEKRVLGSDAVEHHSKLMVLGKPGAGKTTFLKYLAMQCISSRFLPDYVPIFVTLKRFAETKREPELLEYVCDSLLQTKPDVLQRLIDAGKIFFLLDGLDEVREEDTSRVINQIRDVSDRFSRNQFVITCRIAANDYCFEQFTEVEVADFNDEQIRIFAEKWFRAKNNIHQAEVFVEKLKENAPTRELATNPLLLTLLCWIFEEKGDLPKKRHKLYQEGMDLLLEHWDKSRGVARDQAYKNLSLKQRKDLLSKIALNQFERRAYFFELETIEKTIADFLYGLDSIDFDLEGDSKAILKSIEAHHGLLIERAKGIYSFSHLTFQEYFAAREIVESRDPEMLSKLVKHVAEKHWREVFLLTVEMLPQKKADELVQLMKQEIDGLLADDERLQEFLVWVEKKSNSVSVPYKRTAIRALCLAIALDRNFFDSTAEAYTRALIRTLPNISITKFTGKNILDFVSASDRKNKFVDKAISAYRLSLRLDFALNREIPRSYIRRLAFTLDPNLENYLQKLRDQLPDWNNVVGFEEWWTMNGEAWVKEASTIDAEFFSPKYDVRYDWQFIYAQQGLMNQYYDANKLLVDCLNLPDISVSQNVREKIEETLLLPVAP